MAGSAAAISRNGSIASPSTHGVTFVRASMPSHLAADSSR
jgi:hypothetical protein